MSCISNYCRVALSTSRRILIVVHCFPAQNPLLAKATVVEAVRKGEEPPQTQAPKPVKVRYFPESLLHPREETANGVPQKLPESSHSYKSNLNWHMVSNCYLVLHVFCEPKVPFPPHFSPPPPRAEIGIKACCGNWSPVLPRWHQ
jgi:hypothetical protein